MQSAEVAEKLAIAWLQLAMDEATKPPSTEEVTRICPYAGCILFAEHEGRHEFPRPATPDTFATPNTLATNATPRAEARAREEVDAQEKRLRPAR